MCQNDNIHPLKNETPSEYAERLGIYYASQATENEKKELGQYFTPINVSRFMAKFADVEIDKIKILDPGCGIGILSTSITEELADKNNGLKTIELVAFENDSKILKFSEKCFEYLREWLSARNIEFTYFLCKNDFILHNSNLLNGHENIQEQYNIIISNPPYFKLPKGDVRVQIAKSIIFGQTNIYTIFLIIAAKLLMPNGQLIFITPRSFCSGNYFRLFREIFFDLIEFRHFHVFDSRTATFKRDNVLQENIIFSAIKRRSDYYRLDNSHMEQNYKISISASNNIENINIEKSTIYNISELVDFNSFQKIIHLPTQPLDEKIIDLFKTWDGSIRKFNLEISTGPIVSFRNEEYIKINKEKDAVPLFWLHNVEAMSLNWPQNKKNTKGQIKGQYITFNGSSTTRLVNNINCVLLRRFSTKDDKRRLIACPYIASNRQEFSKIGIENHLNYIYDKFNELNVELTIGIAAILNSKLFDYYFRTFNGNINVSATELRDIPLPNIKSIEKLGAIIKTQSEVNLKYDIDILVSDIFNIQFEI